MPMVCPQCRAAFDKQLQCPTCGVRLLFQAQLRSVEPNSDDDESRWQHTPWGRLIVGLALAQGLSQGLQMFTHAGLLAGDRSGVWSTLIGLVLIHGLQGFSLLIAGAITGAGQQRGIMYGSFVGLLNGFIFLILQHRPSDLPLQIAIFGQPILHMAFGALGGLIGTLIWKPLPELSLREGPAEKGKGGALAFASFHLFSGPIHWGRVMAGIGLVVAGVLWSNVILEFVIDASEGQLSISTHLQAQLVRLEITALAMLFGAGIAGATTLNGLKQGLCVGIGAAMIFVGMDLAHLKGTVDSVLLTMVSTLSLTIAGGWFGAHLLPPVGPGRRKRVRIVDL